MSDKTPTELWSPVNRKPVAPVMLNPERVPTVLRTWREFNSLKAENIYRFPFRDPGDVISEAFQIGGEAWGMNNIEDRVLYFRAGRSVPIDWITDGGTVVDGAMRYLKMHLMQTEQIPDEPGTSLERAILKGRILGEFAFALSRFAEMLESPDRSVWGKVPDAIVCSAPYARLQAVIKEVGFDRVSRAIMGKKTYDFVGRSVYILPVNSSSVGNTGERIASIQKGITEKLL